MTPPTALARAIADVQSGEGHSQGCSISVGGGNARCDCDIQHRSKAKALALCAVAEGLERVNAMLLDQLRIRQTDIAESDRALAELREALTAVWTFPGVRELFAPSDSLGSVAAQVAAALGEEKPND